MLRPERLPNVEGFAPQQQVERRVHLLSQGHSENLVGIWTYPPAIREAAAGIFFRPAWGLYDTINGDMFKHNKFSHRFFLCWIIERVFYCVKTRKPLFSNLAKAQHTLLK